MTRAILVPLVLGVLCTAGIVGVVYVAIYGDLFWRRLRGVSENAKALTEDPPCYHHHAVEVRTDNDLDRGTLVAWWCAACETQLPPGSFKAEKAVGFVKHEQTDLQVTRPGDAEWEQETGITMRDFREGPEPTITPSQFDDLNRRFADHRAAYQTINLYENRIPPECL